MKIETFYYNPSEGWSCATFPALDSPNTLVLIFAAKEYIDNQAPFEELTSFYKQSQFIGCSTAGEIYQAEVRDNHIVVAVIQFKETRVKVVHLPVNDKKNSKAIGNDIVNNLLSDELKNIFVLSDGININGSWLVEGMLHASPKKIPISGGLAGDGTRFENTWTFSKERGFCDSGVVAAGFYNGKIVWNYGSVGGWDTFGPERLITRSKDNVLYELDRQSVLPLYKLYLGEHADELPSSALLFPMAIRNPDMSEEKTVRTILSVDEEKDALTFAGNMPEGWYAQLMTSTNDHLLEGAVHAGQQAINSNESSPDNEIFIIPISCVGRRLVLGENTDEELEILLDLFPENTKQIGFYSYGELSPTELNKCDLHNQTMTVTALNIKE